MTSSKILSTFCPSIILFIRNAADFGVFAKTAECIFVPAGIPKTGRFSFTASYIFLAVPSPPAKTRRSTFSFKISFAISVVSSPVVSFFICPTTLREMSRLSSISAPITPGAETISGRLFSLFKISNTSLARSFAFGFAPRSSASF